MNAFEEKETRRHVRFKQERWPDLPDGKHAGRSYSHILPTGHLDNNCYPSIYASLQEYLAEADIALHASVLNLRSSQICCFNFLFPCRLDLGLGLQVFASAFPQVEKVSRIEFEYTGPSEATEWLGEPPGGKRGQNRTSVDAAVWWENTEGDRRLTLIEWKYTEREFGSCGGYESKGNQQKDRCKYLLVEKIRPQLDCYVASGRDSRTSRRYWDLLEQSGISASSYPGVGCPFRGPLYQLLRLYLLREFCQKNIPDLDGVDVVVMGFRENMRNILRVPNYLRGLCEDHGDDIIDVWNRLLTNAPPLRWLPVEDMLPPKDTLVAGQTEWRQYIHERYGV